MRELLAADPWTRERALGRGQFHRPGAGRRRYRAEMAKPEAGHAIGLLATLSRQANFSVGCYCEDEARCHRSILRALLVERGAEVE